MTFPVWGKEKVLLLEKQRTIEALNKKLRMFINHDNNCTLQVKQTVLFLS